MRSPRRDLDGSDELGAHADALDEVRLRHPIRADEPTHSVYHTELGVAGAVGDTLCGHTGSLPHLVYDEWDHANHRYRRAFCHVYPSESQTSVTGYTAEVITRHTATIRSLERRLETLASQRRRVRREPYGDEPDLDAVTDFLARLRSGDASSDRLYVARRRAELDMSLLFLVDTSLSTDGYVSGHRILDTEKEAVVICGELLNRLGARFQIDTFSSRTRLDARYTTVKPFAASWHACRDRVGAVTAEGYTRVGPALRHATAIMRRERARRRWILVLTDGKPTDYDRYEGRYGIEDVRQAVNESVDQGIGLHALAIDAVARHHLPYMFGRAAFTVLRDSTRFAAALAALIMDLGARA